MTETCHLATPGYCHIHDEIEEIPKDGAYQICFECGHVYATETDLLRDYNEAGPKGVDPPKESTEDIFFCPHCLHDF